MISHLDGRVSAIAPEGAVIEVGGVGLLVQCTPGTLATLRPGERARVATSLVVREDALTLFGFAADDERDVFELLQTASGVGPRLALEEEIDTWLAEYRPDAVAVERVFSQHNVRTVMGTAQAGAVAIVCAARRGLPVALHTPSEVKAAVTGSGRADKAQVTAMVMRLLRLADPPRPADTADALALAICHLWRAGTQDRIAAAGSLMERRLAAARRETPDQLAAARRERDQRDRGAR